LTLHFKSGRSESYGPICYRLQKLQVMTNL